MPVAALVIAPAALPPAVPALAPVPSAPLDVPPPQPANNAMLQRKANNDWRMGDSLGAGSAMGAMIGAGYLPGNVFPVGDGGPSAGGWKRRHLHPRLPVILDSMKREMPTRNTGAAALTVLAALTVAALSVAAPDTRAAGQEPMNPPRNAADYRALGRLPDWSGVWTPDITDQIKQERSNPPPWKPDLAKTIAKMYAEEKAGRPFEVIDHCFPTGMPSWMLITHNAFEILFTPGRVTILGEGDGNRLRRIYTDGRPHPADPDPSFHGHSIGHWEADTLVIDTIGVLPEVYLAVNEAVGAPNDGDMHVIERMHLQGADVLNDELEISASRLLTGPWHTTRRYFRQRARKYDIVEGVCTQGGFIEAKDAAALRCTTARSSRRSKER
jgi:hypothetical protein